MRRNLNQGAGRHLIWAISLIWLPILSSCTSAVPSKTLPANSTPAAELKEYVIGPGDQLKIFVWQNTDLSVTVPVRPDGRISVPLLQDVVAAQKTPTQLARDIKQGLSAFIQQPEVTVIVSEFVGAYSEQVRVIGEANEPLLENVQLFDLFVGDEGSSVGAGRKSLAYRLTYRDRSRTLTNEEVTAVHAKIRERLQRELGAELRE